MVTHHYGQKWLRPECLFEIIPPPPPTLWERVKDRVVGIAWATGLLTVAITMAWANPEVFFRAFAMGFAIALAASFGGRR
jgi:hypothetical protein